eukprot:TRINITY_DN7085_c0_g2_i1.p1 TRINITY_DN7085_c0_g2~~TRINITY_DN7085_c0_g2_i1.p1  ORF type:complete len:893 (-),score=342.11 TRINITY_DN7085_c0_g2_i1:10-2688(-)
MMTEGSATSNFTFVGSLEGIQHYTHVKNGLTVLICEQNTAPVATTMVTYHVGSRNEAIGYTGSTHLLEHLMFKGSKNFNKQKGNPIWNVLQNVGASMNATTWNDRTNYYELIPKEHLEVCLEIEADRMRHAFIDEADRQTEMTVVRNEFERGENEPEQALDKAIWATAYQAHPYHHSTIGWRSDIENVPIERLKLFYDTYYWPNNATLTIIGDVNTNHVLTLVDRIFGEIPKSEIPIPKVYTEEPEQEGQRRIVVKRAGKVGVVGVAHKSPRALHPDHYPMQILGNILTIGKTSRFYKSLVDKGLASSVSTDFAPFKDEGLYITYVTLTTGTKHSQVEEIILAEYEKIKKEGVTPEEIARAQAQIITGSAFDRDGPMSMARVINEAIAVGDWRLFVERINFIRQIQVEDVKRVTNRYFLEDLSTVGFFVPRTDEEIKLKNLRDSENRSAESGLKLNLDSQAPRSKDLQVEIPLSTRIQESQPIDGLRLFTLKNGQEKILTVNGSLLAGLVFDKENPTVPSFTAKMLDQGTLTRTKFEISELLGNVGASIVFSVDNFHVRFSARCLSKDLDLILDLITDQLENPKFGDSDLEILRKREITRLEQSKQNTRSRANSKLMQSLYPRDHPNFTLDLEVQLEQARSVQVEDLKKFHGNFYPKSSMNLVIVGDVDDQVVEKVRRNFTGHPLAPHVRSSQIPKTQSSGKNPEEKKFQVEIPDKTSCDVFFASTVGIDREHPDYIPLMIANYVLGGNFSARLMANVRDKAGLTYGIYSYIGGADFSDGFWAIWATFAPDLLTKGTEATLTEVSTWIQLGVSEQELKDKVTSMIGQFKVRLATSAGIAETLLGIIERGKSVSYLEEYPKLLQEATLENVNRCLRQYVKNSDIVTVSAGTFK